MRGPTILLLAGLGATALVCGLALDNSFRADDYVFLNHVVQAKSLGDLLGSSSDFAFYRPAALALFWAEQRLFGFWAGGYLLVNFLLHLANAWLFSRVLRRLDAGAWVSSVGAALFLLGVGHYGKQVLWACTSGGLAAVTMSLTAMLVVLRPPAHPPAAATVPLRLQTVAGVWALLLMAMALHESALAVPILLALLWRRNGVSWPRTLVAFVPALLWIGVLASLSHNHPAYGRAPLGALLAPLYILRYPGFMLFPIRPDHSVLAPLLQVVLAAVMLAIAIVLLRRRDSGPTKFLVLWVYIALMPYGLITLSHWWLEVRYLYFAAMPLCGLLALGLDAVRRHRDMRLRRLAVAASAMLIVGALALQVYMERRADHTSRSDDSVRRLQDLRNRARQRSS